MILMMATLKTKTCAGLSDPSDLQALEHGGEIQFIQMSVVGMEVPSL